MLWSKRGTCLGLMNRVPSEWLYCHIDRASRFQRDWLQENFGDDQILLLLAESSRGNLHHPFSTRSLRLFSSPIRPWRERPVSYHPFRENCWKDESVSGQRDQVQT